MIFLVISRGRAPNQWTPLGSCLEPTYRVMMKPHFPQQKIQRERFLRPFSIQEAPSKLFHVQGLSWLFARPVHCSTSANGFLAAIFHINLNFKMQQICQSQQQHERYSIHIHPTILSTIFSHPPEAANRIHLILILIWWLIIWFWIFQWSLNIIIWLWILQNLFSPKNYMKLSGMNYFHDMG